MKHHEIVPIGASDVDLDVFLLVADEARELPEASYGLQVKKWTGTLPSMTFLLRWSTTTPGLPTSWPLSRPGRSDFVIRSFVETRRDGKVIPESMTVDQMANLGWEPNRIAKVNWKNDEQLVELRAKHGLLAKLLPDGCGVACIRYLDEHAQRCTLTVFNADGSERFVLPNTQVVGNAAEAGSYCWFEPPRADPLNSFGVVFRLDREQCLFQLDFNAHSGTLVGVHPLR